jgi:hypothetical protein
VLRALDALRAQLDADRRSDARPEVFFYYSGHSRANAMNLGPDSLSLGVLRERLLALPTSLTVVVLDACQSGAFSRTKGAGRAADFSYNSVDTLATQGLAVLASSTGKELSQESEELQSSYFTHHLLVGMRGAGDANADGRVSLDEAYRYAYTRTLASTSRTAVGGQHAVLETDLTGQGEVPLTYPAAADAQLRLAGSFEGQVLLQIQPSLSVVAELTQARGAPIAVAVPKGRYLATVRQGGRALECNLSVIGGQAATLDLSACKPVEDLGGRSKGKPEPEGEVWGFDAAIGVGSNLVTDDYEHRLGEFGYEPATLGNLVSPMRWSLGISRKMGKDFALLARVALIDAYSWQTTGDPLGRAFSLGLSNGGDERFSYSATAFDLGVRLPVSLGGEWLVGYGQLDAGLAVATTRFESSNEQGAEETFTGFHGRIAAGLQAMPFGIGGFFLEGGYAYAPISFSMTGENEIGDVHDSGELSIFLGVHGRTWGQP